MAKLRQYGPCPGCGETFNSRYAKRFCSMMCWRNSPEFNQHGARPKVKLECLECGLSFERKPSRSSDRFCCREHYRSYMSHRFDTHFATPEGIALPQGYDEFLTKDKIPCLIPGCEWRGKSLGMHMNITHNIPAGEFKMMAGFNLGTGLCTSELSNKIRSRPHLKQVNRDDIDKARACLRGGRNKYRSLEGNEHRAKSRAVVEEIAPRPKRKCRKCGGAFQQISAFGRRLYCYACRPSSLSGGGS